RRERHHDGARTGREQARKGERGRTPTQPGDAQWRRGVLVEGFYETGDELGYRQAGTDTEGVPTRQQALCRPRRLGPPQPRPALRTTANSGMTRRGSSGWFVKISTSPWSLPSRR